ncbi:hypothetical protein BC832DRAFT_550888 [Gaertneriomyces semiglobifer]|nr:hypothetical protein BC832DRAFT_550888 [Gaertneriomyces semiglobifer]
MSLTSPAIRLPEDASGIRLILSLKDPIKQPPSQDSLHRNVVLVPHTLCRWVISIMRDCASVSVVLKPLGGSFAELFSELQLRLPAVVEDTTFISVISLTITTSMGAQIGLAKCVSKSDGDAMSILRNLGKIIEDLPPDYDHFVDEGQPELDCSLANRIFQETQRVLHYGLIND